MAATESTAEETGGLDPAAAPQDGVEDQRPGTEGVEVEPTGTELWPAPPEAVGDPYENAPTLPPMSEEVRAAAAARIKVHVDALSSYRNGAKVVDMENGQVIYEHFADRALIPASNTKLFTTAFGLEALGAEHRFETRAYGTMSADGDVDGNLTVVFGHDFSFAHHHESLASYLYKDRSVPFMQLARRIYESGVRRIGGKVVASGEVVVRVGTTFCDRGLEAVGVTCGSSVDYTLGEQRRLAASELRRALLDVGVEVVGGTAEVGTFAPPADTEALAVWRSLPLGVAASPINVPSHNPFADLLIRHLGDRMLGEGTYPGGTDAGIEWLQSLGIDTRDTRFRDGSGLSHANRVSPSVTVDLIRTMLSLPEGPAWLSTFAISGTRGTLSSRMTGSSTRGRFWGKTGTLNDTAALSGIFYHPHDGHRYLVSLISNRERLSAGTVRSRQNSMIVALANDHRDLGDRPDAPVLRSVLNDRNGETISIDWEPSDGAESYIVWFSDDGQVWDRARTRGVQAPPFRADGLAADHVHVRVTAVNAAGESDPSDAYVTRVSPEPAAILLVDANDRWQGDPVRANPMGMGHTHLARYAAVLGATVDSVDDAILEDQEVQLHRYAIVIWILGSESEAHLTFDFRQRELIAEYLDGGGRLIVTGSELGYDLNRVADAAEFMHDYLHLEYESDNAGAYGVLAPGDVAPMFFHTPHDLLYRGAQERSTTLADTFIPLDGSEAAFQYTTGSGAGVFNRTAHKVASFGFALEAVSTDDDRKRLLDAAINYLMTPE